MLNIFWCSLPRLELPLGSDASGTADFFPMLRFSDLKGLGWTGGCRLFKVQLEEGVRFKEAGGRVLASLRLVGEQPLNLNGFVISLGIFNPSLFLLNFQFL